MQNIWQQTSDLIIGEFNITINEIKQNYKNIKEYAIFDLDATLITTKSNCKFPKSKDDWKLLPNVKEKLKQYRKSNSVVIIITNQKGLKNNAQIENYKLKIQDIAKLLKKFIIFIILGDGKYRKPNTAVWDQYLEFIDKQKSFFCGDACGRVTDFSDTDYKFALNIGITFYTPEYIFKNLENCPGKITYPNLKKKIINKFVFKEKINDFVILVGKPGSGKTSFCKKYLKNYKIINQDNLKTQTKCIKQITNICAINPKANIVIDNTNPSEKKRKQFIEIAKSNGYDVRCIIFDIPKNIAKHNNFYRFINFDNTLIPEIAFRIYEKNFEYPNLNEGFSEILTYQYKINKKLVNNSYYKYYY